MEDILMKHILILLVEYEIIFKSISVDFFRYLQFISHNYYKRHLESQLLQGNKIFISNEWYSSFVKSFIVISASLRIHW